MTETSTWSLQQLDLAMFNSAAHYDLSQKPERLRSVADLERFFFRLSGVIQPDLFIEAGARDGRSSIRARRHINGSRIVAFEANPLNFNRHVKNPALKASNVEYVHRALSDHNGEITFNIQIVNGRESADGQGSILQRNELSEGSKPVTVAATRLDNYFAPGSFKSCCVWMDVEGASREVLVGAKELLQSITVLYIEVEDRQVWEGQWLASDVSSYLFSAGLVPVARDYQSRYQYNILFIKRDTLHDPRVRFALTEHVSRVGSKSSLAEAAAKAASATASSPP